MKDENCFFETFNNDFYLFIFKIFQTVFPLKLFIFYIFFYLFMNIYYKLDLN